MIAPLADDERPALARAIHLATSTRFAAHSYLMRKLGFDYVKVARLLDLMESMHVIGPREGTKAPDVLVSLAAGFALADSIKKGHS